MVTATFRFHEALNDFLAKPLRRREFSCVCARDANVKHMIEALGVPHTEVELILVNGASVDFHHPLADGDRVAVYPKGDAPGMETLDILPLSRVRAEPLRVVHFIADAHLGGLAPLLRLAGFDTLYDNHYPDADIEALAAKEQRIVLTRDRELLKRRGITHGCYVRSLKPREQLHEVFARFELTASAQPFRLCLTCNAPLRRIAKDEVGDRAPEGVLARHHQFVTCDICRRVFWEGTHWQRMCALMDGMAAVGS